MLAVWETNECFFRAGKIEEALSFAQTKLSEAGESIPEALCELERTLALLAFEKPQNSPFADLLEQSHRQKVREHVFLCYFRMQNIPRSIAQFYYGVKAFC